ncbi:hypothetical protein FJQ54_03995 [Sandaracinobacter neustonicus]|uniref:Uncharacterized protein n=1 Tax=Sandaracinobacter neustonicus TaxID=1715348 RepID=A0A501XU34_9SPHN|nr:hypothetical protein [Sandaracinobacter neustonicus]TPE64005.1 hypothetical protein FJQ54_03995 [Sandaracinobacter neustonicus]
MSNRFVVDLGDLKLDAAAKRRISNALQTAALGELARLDSVMDAPFAVFDPVRIRDPQWYGIWVKTLRDRAVLPELDMDMKAIQQFARGG